MTGPALVAEWSDVMRPSSNALSIAWTGLLTIGLLLGANAGFAATELPLARLTDHPMQAGGQWDYRLGDQNRPWLAYYDETRLLRLRNPDGSERLLTPEGREQAPSGLGLAGLGTGVALLWRDKLPEKGLYLFDSTRADQPPLNVGGETQPLPRLAAAALGDNKLHLLWYGEQGDSATGAHYHLYYRQLDRRTQNLSEIERLMPGVYPVWATDVTGGVMVFSWSMDETPKRILARYRPAGADAFREAASVAEVPGMTPIFRAFRSGSRWFVVWVSQDVKQTGGVQAAFSLKGAWSEDAGKTWAALPFDELQGLDLGGLNIASDNDGHILLAMSGRRDRNAKSDVYLIGSNDGGTTWSKLQRLRPEGRYDGFQARHPSVAFGSVPGQVLVVWEDWREIRSRLYANYSTDYGRTWAQSNVPLIGTPGINLGMRFDVNSIYAVKDRFHILAEQSSDDTLRSKVVVGFDLSAADLASLAAESAKAQPTQADVESALRKRAGEFWEAMIANDYSKTYAFQDPFYRARWDGLAYLTKMGRIKYTGYSVEKVEINGHRAQVTSKIKASVPPFKAQTTGETIQVPEQEREVTAVWVQVDGIWYQEYKIAGEDAVFTRY